MKLATGAQRAEWDERAARLYEEFRRPARAMVRRAFGSTFDESEIEDFYSAAWLGTLRALAGRHSNLSDDEVRSYLLTAVANHAGKEIRRRKRKPIAPLDDAATVVPDVAVSPEETVSSREESQITRDVLSSLPPRRRAVMLLRYGLDLEPKEVCGLVKGLSHRAYRKEISRGVDEMTAKLRRVDAGGWCEDREPVLKAYAAGIADSDQTQQAEKHMAHCKHCSQFVGRLSGHLHDLGSAIALPGALDSADGHLSIPDRVGDLITRMRGDSATGSASEVANAASATRGSGAVGGGLVAKFAALGGAGKIAAACVGGGLAATACVAVGVGPILAGSGASAPAKAKEAVDRSHHDPNLARVRRPPISPQEVTPVSEAQPQPPEHQQSEDQVAPEPTATTTTEVTPSPPPVQESAVQPPPVQAETGLAPPESVGASSGSSSSGPSQSQQNAQQEFGP